MKNILFSGESFNKISSALRYWVKYCIVSKVLLIRCSAFYRSEFLYNSKHAVYTNVHFD